MARPTYFLTNCTILFGWGVFIDCVKIYESLRGIFYVPLLFFSHNQIFPVWVSLSICMENLFSQNIRDEDSMLGVLILCHLLDKKFSATSL